MASSSRQPDRLAGASTGAAIGLSGMAAFVGLCCIGPWAVALLGVSGAVALAEWQPYRPLILGIALVLLGWAFWRVYLRAPACDAGGCAVRPSRWLKLALWTALAMLLLAIFAPDLQTLLFDPTPKGLEP